MRTFVRLAAAILALIFAWLKFRGIPMPRIASDDAATFVFRSALVIYYFAWLAGVIMDTRDEEDTLCAVPGKGKIPLLALALCIFMAGMFALLCWVDSYQKFVVVLAAFWMVNVVGWRYLLKHFLGPAIRRSLTTWGDEKAYFRFEQLRETERYIAGSWNWVRFSVGGALLLLIALLAYSRAADWAAARTGFLSPSLVIALSIFAFVLLMEGWIWSYRLRRRLIIGCLEEMKVNYAIEKKGADTSGG